MPVIFSLGYSNHTSEDFTLQLAATIKAIVERSMPFVLFNPMVITPGLKADLMFAGLTIVVT